MDHKEETLHAYNTYPDTFSTMFTEHFNTYLKLEADRFLACIQGNTILDLGAGNGAHAKYFQNKGKKVLCADLSPAMVALCTQQGLRAEIKDIDHLDYPDHSFDGVWAYASLLHLKKTNVPNAIKNIARILFPNGIFGLALKEGHGEKYTTKNSCPGTQRWFCYFTDEEVQTLVKPYFDVIHKSRTVITPDHVFINYLLKRR